MVSFIYLSFPAKNTPVLMSTDDNDAIICGGCAIDPENLEEWKLLECYHFACRNVLTIVF